MDQKGSSAALTQELDKRAATGRGGAGGAAEEESAPLWATT